MTASCRNLIILRAGDGSLHRGWLAGTRDFDILISYYGTQPDLHRADADYYEMRPGPKWPCIADLLAERGELLDRYDAFWLPDDDLAATTETLNRMFALFHGFDLALAQPALTRDSYYSWPGLLQNPDYVLRYATFVEVMAPIFDRSTLKACLKTFDESRSGWGLDCVWPSLLDRGRPDSVAVLDATPVRHTRPVGGELYRNHPELDPPRELQVLTERYGVPLAPVEPRFQSGVARVSPGWWRRFRVRLRDWDSLRRHRPKMLQRSGSPGR